MHLGWETISVKEAKREAHRSVMGCITKITMVYRDPTYWIGFSFFSDHFIHIISVEMILEKKGEKFLLSILA